MKHKLRIKHCLWYALAGLAVFLLAAYRFDLLGAQGAERVLSTLSDAFLMPGVLLSGVAAITWTAYLGTYDMIGYGMKSLFFFIPKVNAKREKTFYDYRQAREKGRDWLREMLVVGLAFLAFAVLSVILSELV